MHLLLGCHGPSAQRANTLSWGLGILSSSYFISYFIFYISIFAGENDAAIKEILPIVLLAYQGSKLAEEKGGRLSSMVFFVYNRIDTQEKDKLGNILQILGTSLHEAFHKVSQLNGVTDEYWNSSGSQKSLKSQNSKGTGLFRRFKLDATNSNESDVRVLGNIKKNYVPPDDVPDPAYGKALCEFREHIHSRVTGQDPGSSTQWKSRSLTEIFEYLQLVWLCIRSADFTLNFKTVVERAAFDQLSNDYKRYEKELTDAYYDCNAYMEKEILSKKQQVQVDDLQFDVLKLEFENLVCEEEHKLEDMVKEALEQPGRSKWKADFEHQWMKFRSVEKQRWVERLRSFFQCQLKYDLHVADYKKKLRLQIREMFNNVDNQSLSEHEKNETFNQLFNQFLAYAEYGYPALDVGKRVEEVYINNSRMKMLQIELLHKETVAKVKSEISYLSGTPKPNDSIFKRMEKVFSSGVNFFFNSNQSANIHHEAKQALWNSIVNCTQQAETYMDPLVDQVINITILITNQYGFHHKEIQYAHIFAKTLVTILLEDKQRQWESRNSVAAKLGLPSTKQEMKTYFDSVSQGIEATELLVETLGTNLQNILPKAFDQEVIRTVDLRIRTKSWLSDPKALQARIDLTLLELIDAGKVGRALEFIRHSSFFYERVLADLIANEFPDLNKNLESFKTTLKHAFKSAVAAALSAQSKKAKKFIDELNSQCLDLFKDNYLAMNLITDSDGYEGCDNEEDHIFHEKCLNLLELSTSKILPNVKEREWKEELIQKVLLYMRDVRREDVARPRCNAACPLCASLCIHPENHDTAVKHDTFHQTGGLIGSFWNSEVRKVELRDTLCRETCSMHLSNKDEFFFDGEWRSFNDFSLVYPQWMEPKFMERLPLREYIFANYQEDIVKKYDCKPCIDIPLDYYHDLETIRSDLKRAANLSQDKYAFVLLVFPLLSFTFL